MLRTLGDLVVWATRALSRSSLRVAPLVMTALAALAVPAAAQSSGRTLGVQIAPDSPRDTLGVQLTAVSPGSLAERIGLRAGDRLLRVGRVDLVRHRTDPRNAASGLGRMRVALADTASLVPVLVWRNGALLTGIGAWSGSVPVPLQDAEAIIGAFTTLATQGVVPVETAGSVAVPSTGGAGSVPAFGEAAVPSTGGAGSVPAFGDVRVPSTGGTGSGSGDAGLGNRAWRAACSSMAGPRFNAKYFWLSGSGSSSEQLWLNSDGSYSTQRSSAYSSYAEDGCYAIAGGRITFYKALSSAMASAPGATSDRRVSLGSASDARFEPRTVSFARDGDALVIDGDRYAPTSR